MSKHTAKGKQGEPPDKLPQPEDIDDDGANEAVPAEPTDDEVTGEPEEDA